MKASNKNTRWLLLALLFGVIAAAGLMLTRHHGSATLAKATHAAATPRHAAAREPQPTLLAAIGGKRTLWTVTAAHPGYEPVSTADSNTPQPRGTGRSGTPASTATVRAWSNLPADPAGGSSNATPSPQSNRPAASSVSHLPQDFGGGLAYNGYAPLDCELPAGCGASSGANGNVSRPTTAGTSGAGQPFVHDSQGSSPNDGGSSPPTDDGNPPPGNNGGQQGSGTQDPPSNPGSNAIASAPELDPATLAGALTLLLGSLAVLRRRRRVRATH